MEISFTERGFLPAHDPAVCFPPDSELAMLDQLGQELPVRLLDSDFRAWARALKLPHWSEASVNNESLPLLRLYYVRIGFLASAYINQVGQPKATVLPANIAQPLCDACHLLGRQPILSYDGYALYNWKRLDSSGPIALGNIESIQNFVSLYDEHWFILVHVEIEAIASEILGAIGNTQLAIREEKNAEINEALKQITLAVKKQIKVLKRIPEKMNPALYFKEFRPYIRFFENVVYEGVTSKPMDYRGETGAQSSIMPTLIAFMKIPHQQSALTNHLAEMRRFMPPAHRAFIEEVEKMPSIKNLAEKCCFNEVLEAIATFREVHFKWAQEYINQWVTDPRGTGGTPYMSWLEQLIKETRAHMI